MSLFARSVGGVQNQSLKNSQGSDLAQILYQNDLAASIPYGNFKTIDSTLHMVYVNGTAYSHGRRAWGAHSNMGNIGTSYMTFCLNRLPTWLVVRLSLLQAPNVNFLVL